MHGAYSRTGISATQTPGIFILCMYFLHSGIYSRAVFSALLTNGDTMQSALQSAQTQLGDMQHTQWSQNDIPTLSLEADIKSAGGRLTLPNHPQIIVDLHRHMEAVRRGTLFKCW